MPWQVCFFYSDGRGGGGDFVAGFLLGGAVFGTLAYIFAPQVIECFILKWNYDFGFDITINVLVQLGYLYVLSDFMKLTVTCLRKLMHLFYFEVVFNSIS